ncbi:flagellar basal body-associated FliL family protein [bacterium]|nr:flagellar basal body-associated FliL family protein [bacterium]
MANEEKEQSQQEQVKKKKSPLKFIIIGLAIMIIIPVIGFFVVSKFVIKDENVEKAKKEEAMKVGEIFPLDIIVVNIAGTGGTRYLRAGISFEVIDSAVLSELNQRIPQIKDLIIMILSVKELEDLLDFSGKNQIRKEILEKVNALLRSGKIKSVYFTEFVIQ